MNYLAHLFLSCENEDHLIGNFIADSIKRPEGLNFSPQIIEGIHLHKLIDSYTDSHPVVKRSTRRLHFAHSKYSSVVLDIWYDYLLAKNWDRYSNLSLRNFADKMYEILRRRVHDMPGKMQLNLPEMAADDWLLKYSNMDGMLEMFNRLAKRVSRPELLNDMEGAFRLNEFELEQDFLLFFPALQNHIESNHIHIH